MRVVSWGVGTLGHPGWLWRCSPSWDETDEEQICSTFATARARSGFSGENILCTPPGLLCAASWQRSRKYSLLTRQCAKVQGQDHFLWFLDDSFKSLIPALDVDWKAPGSAWISEKQSQMHGAEETSDHFPISFIWWAKRWSLGKTDVTRPGNCPVDLLLH